MSTCSRSKFLSLGLATVLIISACGDDKEKVVQVPAQADKVMLIASFDSVPEGGVLLRNGEQQVRIESDGVHQLFLVAQGETFALEVAEPPYDSQCDISNGEGTATGMDVRDIVVHCYDIDSAPILNTPEEAIESSYKRQSYVFFFAMDIEGAEMAFSTSLVSAPEGATFIEEAYIRPHDNYHPSPPYQSYVLIFHADTVGDYRFTISASDGSSISSKEILVTLQNQPPSIFNVDIQPTAPNTLDILELPYLWFSDLEDEVTNNIQWYVNDTLVLEGAEKGELAAEYFSKGDTVKVVVTASDGSNEVSQEDTTVIGDAEGRLSLINMPKLIAEGELVEFDIVWEDPDNDSIPTGIVLQGPTGASVDAAGKVSWQVPDLAFSSQQFEFSFSVADTDQAPVSGFIEAIGTEKNAPIVRTSTAVTTQGSHLKLLATASPDINGVQKIYASDGSNLVFSLQYDNGGFHQDWAYPYNLIDNGTIRSISLADVDGDNTDDLLVAGGKTVAIINGRSGQLIGKHEYDFHILDIEAADFNNDGNLQVAILLTQSHHSSNQTLYLARATELADYQIVVGTRYGRRLAVGNVDSDPALEIIASAGSVYDGVTLTNEWLRSTEFGDYLAVGDLDNDGIDEIIGATSDKLSVFSAASKERLHQISATTCSLQTADVLDDAAYEVLIGPCYGEGLKAYQWTNNALMPVWTADDSTETSHHLSAGDVDGDGNIEIVYQSNYRQARGSIGVIEPAAATLPQWIDTEQSGFRSGFWAGGIQTGGTEAFTAVFLATQWSSANFNDSGTRVVRINASGELTISPQLDGNTGSGSGMVLIDTDNNEQRWLVGLSRYCAVIDPDTSATEWSSGPNSFSNACRNIKAVDTDGDGISEAAFINNGRLEIHNIAEQRLLWSSDLNYQVIDFEIANLDEDVDLEIAISSHNSSRIYDRNNDTYVLLASSDRGLQFHTSYDIDQDGNQELVATDSRRPTKAVEFIDSEFSTINSFTTLNWADDVMIRTATEIYVVERAPFSNNNSHIAS